MDNSSTINNGTVVILRGTSGSGKSTYIKNNLSDALVCSADDYWMIDGEYKFDATKLPIAHNECYKKFQKALEDKQPLIVVDNTNITLKEVERYLLPAKAAGYNIRIVRMDTPLEVLVGRNVHNVPDEVVKRMHSKLEDIPKHWGVTELFAKGY